MLRLCMLVIIQNKTKNGQICKILLFCVLWAKYYSIKHCFDTLNQWPVFYLFFVALASAWNPILGSAGAALRVSMVTAVDAILVNTSVAEHRLCHARWRSSVWKNKEISGITMSWVEKSLICMRTFQYYKEQNIQNEFTIWTDMISYVHLNSIVVIWNDFPGKPFSTMHCCFEYQSLEGRLMTFTTFTTSFHWNKDTALHEWYKHHEQKSTWSV